MQTAVGGGWSVAVELQTHNTTKSVGRADGGVGGKQA